MNSLRKVVLILVLATALGAAVVAPAAAETPAPQGAALACNSGTCQLVGDVAGPLGLLQAGANLALTQLPFQRSTDGNTQATLDAKQDITLSLPIGDVTLTNARLQVEVDAGGKIKRLNGYADMPFPTFGLLNNVQVAVPARASVGLDLGKNLPDIGVEVQPDRSYLFFNANSFMSVTGRTMSSADPFSLAFTPGQRLTLVVDTVDPVAYLNGQVTMSITDQVALLGGVLESTPLGPYLPDTLPLRERTQFGLSGKFSKDIAQSQLTLRGGYVLEPGLLPKQLGVDAQLVSLLGELTLGKDGVLVDGVLKSTIQPDKIFDGSVRVTTFIALNELAGPSHAGLDASLNVPAAKLGVGAGVQAGGGSYALSGQLRTPFTGKQLTGQVAGKLPDVAGAIGPALGRAAGVAGTAARGVGSAGGVVAGAVGTGAGKAGEAVGLTAGNTAAFVGPLASKAAGLLSGYARFGLESAGNAVHAGEAKLKDGIAAEAEL